GFRGVVGVGHHLDHALAVPEVHEHHATHVTTAGHPSGDDHVPTDVLRPKLPRHVGPAPRKPVAHSVALRASRTWEMASSRVPSDCVPSDSRRHVTVPAAASRSPMIRANPAPLRSAAFIWLPSGLDPNAPS